MTMSQHLLILLIGVEVVGDLERTPNIRAVSDDHFRDEEARSVIGEGMV